jgi:hypothetical protein
MLLGACPPVVVELPGHSPMKLIMGLYRHVMPALAREAAHRMARWC